ncbi:MAG TPA: hypothetical protein VE871_06120 [Longimicrobium sp.]|nr:hypothetical protein [Longimicrobium sp.]
MQPTRRKQASRTFGIRWQNVVLWGTVILGLPVVFVGILLQLNEYYSPAGGYVNCDGPVMARMAAVLATILYWPAGLVFLRRAVRGRRWGAGLAAAACIGIVAGAGTTWENANRQESTSRFREACVDPYPRR